VSNPYYESGGIKIFLGDCREIMPTLERVDVIVCDPPYGEVSFDWDKQVRGWMDVAESVTNNLWCFGSLQLFMDMARRGDDAHWNRAQELVWEKHNGSAFHADRFKRVHELIVQFYRGTWESVYKAPVFTSDATARTVRRKERPPHTGEINSGKPYVSHDGGPRLMRSVIYARSCHGYAEHPCQKPIEIIDPLLRYSAKASVLDPFMGSGSTLVAAKALGLAAVGIDIDERCCETAALRLRQEFLPLSAVHTSEARA
jgi:site-specific DNA-methyltransferase (adenine-specific)